MQLGKEIPGRYAVLLFIILVISFSSFAGFAAAMTNGGGMFAELVGVTMGLIIGSVMLLALLWPEFGPGRARS